MAVDTLLDFIDYDKFKKSIVEYGSDDEKNSSGSGEECKTGSDGLSDNIS